MKDMPSRGDDAPAENAAALEETEGSDVMPGQQTSPPSTTRPPTAPSGPGQSQSAATSAAPAQAASDTATGRPQEAASEAGRNCTSRESAPEEETEWNYGQDPASLARFLRDMGITQNPPTMRPQAPQEPPRSNGPTFFGTTGYPVPSRFEGASYGTGAMEWGPQGHYVPQSVLWPDYGYAGMWYGNGMGQQSYALQPTSAFFVPYWPDFMWFPGASMPRQPQRQAPPSQPMWGPFGQPSQQRTAQPMQQPGQQQPARPAMPQQPPAGRPMQQQQQSMPAQTPWPACRCPVSTTGPVRAPVASTGDQGIRGRPRSALDASPEGRRGGMPQPGVLSASLFASRESRAGGVANSSGSGDAPNGQGSGGRPMDSARMIPPLVADLMAATALVRAAADQLAPPPNPRSDQPSSDAELASYVRERLGRMTRAGRVAAVQEIRAVLDDVAGQDAESA
ncbi:uncharacterized protein LOC144149032 isoform X2 [Haemaphysalis longicornis]